MSFGNPQIVSSSGSSVTPTPPGPLPSIPSSYWKTDKVDICSQYGADPSLADNSSVFQTALYELGNAGRIGYLAKSGIYTVLNPVAVGNGNGSTVPSTWTAKILGPGGINVTTAGTVVAYAGAAIKYGGPAGAPGVFELFGPLSGFEIGNLTIQGGSGALTSPLTNTCIANNAGFWGEFHDLLLLGASSCFHGLSSNANRYRNIVGKWGAKAGTAGPLPGGLYGGLWFDTNGSGDTFFEDFQNVQLNAPGTASGLTHTFLYYGPCDNVKITTLRCVRHGTDTIYSAVYDYSTNASWPSDCSINGVDFDGPPAGSFINVGVPGGTTPPNRIYGISAANGNGSIPTDPGLSNLVYNSASAMLTGTAVLVAGTVTVANTRITANSVVRAANVKAGGAVGALSVALTAGTSFTVNSTSATDTSLVYYEVVYY